MEPPWGLSSPELRAKGPHLLSEELETDSAAAGFDYNQRYVAFLSVCSSKEAEGTPHGFAHQARRWAHGREEPRESMRTNPREGAVRPPRVHGTSAGVGSLSACQMGEEGLPEDAEGGQEDLAKTEARESCQDHRRP